MLDFIFNEPHRLCNYKFVLSSVDGGFEPHFCQTKYYKIGISKSIFSIVAAILVVMLKIRNLHICKIKQYSFHNECPVVKECSKKGSHSILHAKTHSIVCLWLCTWHCGAIFVMILIALSITGLLYKRKNSDSCKYTQLENGIVNNKMEQLHNHRHTMECV
jgi:hypothetical protein